jgi:hypothetical protein
METYHFIIRLINILLKSRTFYNETLLSGDFSELIDFFCWTFSQSTNLIDLLTTEKQQSGKSREIESEKKVDSSFYVTTNWRFMKGLNFYFLILGF